MNSLTNKGEQWSLLGNGTAGSIARLATAIRLYTSASVPTKAGVEGVDFIQLANGGGYTSGGKTVAVGDWTGGLVGSNYGITLADQTWTGTGSGMPSIAGAYLVDAANNVLAWWSRSTVSVPSGQTFTLTGIRIELRTGIP